MERPPKKPKPSKVIKPPKATKPAAAGKPRKRPSSNLYRRGTKPEAVLARKREGLAVAMRLEGKTIGEIAEACKYANNSCARNAIMRAMVRLCPPENSEALRAQEVARTYEIEREAWEQWYRSTEDAVKETIKSVPYAGNGNGDVVDAKTEKTVVREGQSGNPALLDKILKAMERRARLLGLDAPEKIDLNQSGEIRVIGQNPVEVLEQGLKRARGEKNAAG